MSDFHLQCGQVAQEARERFGKEAYYSPIPSKLRYSRTTLPSLELFLEEAQSHCLAVSDK